MHDRVLAKSSLGEVIDCMVAWCRQSMPCREGAGPAPRTTRIFVARIPPMVSDVEFRQYFERFGQVQVELSCLQSHSLGIRLCGRDQ